MAVTVQHIGFTCGDKVAQENFYVKHFGFRRARVFNAGKADEFVMLRLGDTCLELFPAAVAGAAGRASQGDVGFRHLCFQVPDVAAKAAELNADGVKTGRVIDAGEHVPGLKVCFFNDPDGNSIELMEGWRDEQNPPSMA